MGIVPVVAAMKRIEIEQRANNMLSALQPDAMRGSEPTNIELIFDSKLPRIFSGLMTGYRKLAPNEYGKTDAAAKTSFIQESLAMNDTKTGIRFLRSTIGHETGHVDLHVSYLNMTFVQNDLKPMMRSRKDIPAFQDPEWQAWEYAGAILMPKHLVQQYFNQGRNASYMADAFDVNPSFVLSRLRKLKLASW